MRIVMSRTQDSLTLVTMEALMMDSSLAKALARETVELERHAVARPQNIRRLPQLRGERIESAMELRFQGVENMIRAMDNVIGRGLRKPKYRRR